MVTRYVREFGFKETLTDSESLKELNFMIEKLLPAIERGDGIISVSYTHLTLPTSDLV